MLKKMDVRWFMSLVVWIMSMVILTGCQPLRKKFTRKKKESKNSDKFIPVLSPIDYEEKIHSTSERYLNRYRLWKVWYSEFLQSLDQRESAKRLGYSLTNMQTQLEELMPLVVPEKQQILLALINEHKELFHELGESDSRQNRIIFRRKIERIARRIRAELTPKVMTESYVDFK